VKTAISLPDDLFDRVNRHAQHLGMSRSEFFAAAAARWADELDGAELTVAIDRAVAEGAVEEDLTFLHTAARLLPSE
jgi:metal-responsive CopG/Arc/MetJ family transcriptional regulator